MLAKSRLFLTVSPHDSRVALTYGVPVAHAAYRVGGGPHLFRAAMPIAVRGGLMVIDDAGFDGLGDAAPFCREVMRECLARNFDGVICDFEARPFTILGKIVSELGELMAKRGWPLYVTEPYARFSEKSKVLISSALSGGSLKQRLGEAVNAYGPERVALSVERVAEDFFLPSPTGQGVKLSREELARRMEELAPSVFFSGELCAHYFTYMSSKTGAHFILFDDGGSIRKKLQIARSMEISDAILPFAQVSDLLPELLK